MAKRRRNGNGFARVFEQLGKDATEEGKKALEKGADMVVQDAKSLVPVKTGALQASISWEWNRAGKAIRITAPAVNPKTGVHYGQYVEFWPGRQHPFMYPAMDANRDKVKEMVIEAIREAVRKNGTT